MNFIKLLKLKLIKKKGAKLGLVLGSGGARGFAHIGVLKVLEENQIPIHCITGSSAGSMVGGMYSAGVSIKEIEKLVSKLSFTMIARLLLPTFAKGGLADSERVIKYIKPAVGDKRIEELDIKFGSVSTDLYSGKAVEFRKGDLLESIKSSIAIPGVFKPVMTDGKCLVDGGVVNPLPINLAKKMGAEFILAVDVISAVYDFHKNTSIFKVPALPKSILLSINIFERNIIKNIIHKFKPDVLIRPKMTDVGVFDFHKGHESIESGQNAMNEALSKVRHLI